MWDTAAAAAPAAAPTGGGVQAPDGLDGRRWAVQHTQGSLRVL
jgi:hypothetical protein